VAALAAFACGIILEELDYMIAFGTLCLKNRCTVPITAVLSRALHGYLLIASLSRGTDEAMNTPSVPLAFINKTLCNKYFYYNHFKISCMA
jgi:hypothetical protein